VETGIGSAQLRYIIEESERRGWRVLRHQIADHSPKGSHENKVLHSLQFFKRKEKKRKDCASLSPFSCGK
jgi:L-amino acid N-acyltransferase YncA